MIVILSAAKDAHLPFVTRHLKKAEYVIIDVAEILAGNSLTYVPTTKGQQVIYNGYSIKNVTGVWLRRPSLLDSLPIPVEDHFIPYVESSLRNHMRQLYTCFWDALWMSDKYAIDKAENKTLQLCLASQIGFNVPEAIFTSDAKTARAFVERRPHSIVKSQANVNPTKANGESQGYFATKISPKTKVDYSGLDLAPSIFQHAINHAFDIRVTVVGDEVFATRIDVAKPKGNKRVRDWRLGYFEGNLCLTAWHLPEKITQACITLTKKLGLSYGAIDLVQDKAGKIWFLEINPNGQWAFVEEDTGQPIGKAIAMLLKRG